MRKIVCNGEINWTVRRLERDGVSFDKLFIHEDKFIYISVVASFLYDGW